MKFFLSIKKTRKKKTEYLPMAQTRRLSRFRRGDHFGGGGGRRSVVSI
jgi:hypothetical protein